MKELPEHYPAPSIPEAIPPTERVLAFLIDERGNSAELLFSLANVLLRKGRTLEALKYYRMALELEPHSPKLRTNLGVSLILLGEREDAEQQFRAALLQEPDLELALLHLGTLLEERHEHEGALKLLERYLQGKSSAKPAFLAGRCAAALGKIDSARKYYQTAAAGGIEEALAWLLADDVKKAVEAFAGGDVVECGRILHRNYDRAPGLFGREQNVQEAVRELAVKAASAVRPKNFETTLLGLSAEEQPAAVYRYLLERLLSFGVLAEVFEEFEELEPASARWQQTVAGAKNYPYGNYRHAIITALRGQFAAALNEFDLCRSKLPEKKQHVLKLRQIVEVVSLLRDAQGH